MEVRKIMVSNKAPARVLRRIKVVERVRHRDAQRSAEDERGRQRSHDASRYQRQGTARAVGKRDIGGRRADDERRVLRERERRNGGDPEWQPASSAIEDEDSAGKRRSLKQDPEAVAERLRRPRTERRKEDADRGRT